MMCVYACGMDVVHVKHEFTQHAYTIVGLMYMCMVYCVIYALGTSYPIWFKPYKVGMVEAILVLH